MPIQRIQPGKRLSAAVVHGDTIYLAGQIAGDASADVKGQTQQILKKIDDLLAAAGSNKSKLLSATIWLADMRYFEDMNSVWDAWMDSANPPARATVEARLERVGCLDGPREPACPRYRRGEAGRAQVLRRDRGRRREVSETRGQPLRPPVPQPATRWR